MSCSISRCRSYCVCPGRNFHIVFLLDVADIKIQMETLVRGLSQCHVYCSFRHCDSYSCRYVFFLEQFMLRDSGTGLSNESQNFSLNLGFEFEAGSWVITL